MMGAAASASRAPEGPQKTFYTPSQKRSCDVKCGDPPRRPSFGLPGTCPYLGQERTMGSQETESFRLTNWRAPPYRQRAAVRWSGVASSTARALGTSCIFMTAYCRHRSAAGASHRRDRVRCKSMGTTGKRTKDRASKISEIWCHDSVELVHRRRDRCDRSEIGRYPRPKACPNAITP